MTARGLVLLVLAAVLAGCGGSSSPEHAAAPEPGVVHALAGVPQLASAFARDDGVARLVLLLSPT